MDTELYEKVCALSRHAENQKGFWARILSKFRTATKNDSVSAEVIFHQEEDPVWIQVRNRGDLQEA